MPQGRGSSDGWQAGFEARRLPAAGEPGHGRGSVYLEGIRKRLSSIGGFTSTFCTIIFCF